jgi:hypothetical protein
MIPSIGDSPASRGRHRIDLPMPEASKRKPPIDPLKAVFLVFAHMIALEPLARRLGADHPEVTKALNVSIEDVRRQYNRKLQAEALRRRWRCQKSDIPRLLALPGEKSPWIYRLAERLARVPGLGGRGVIPEPRTFDQAFSENFAVWPRLAAAEPHQRRVLHKRHMPKYPGLIYAAYQGELAIEKRRRITERRLPGRPKASEIAEDRVAEAAGISRPLVHQLCQQERDEFKAAQRWAAAGPGRGVEPEPAITAAQLRLHLEG